MKSEAGAESRLSHLGGIVAWFEQRLVWPTATAMLLLGMTIMMTEALSRFALDRSYFWAEESVRFLVVWSVFLTMGLAGRKGRHIRTEMLVQIMPQPVQRMLNAVAGLAGLAFSAFMLYGSWLQLRQYRTLGMTSESGLDLPMWLVYAVVPFGSVMLLFYYCSCLVDVVAGKDPFEAHARSIDEEQML